MRNYKKSQKEREFNIMVNEYSIDRLFNTQRINLEMLSHYIIREDLYDRNDCNKLLQEIISLNLVISKKLEKNEKRK